MFIEQLDMDEKKALMRLLVYIAKADGKLVEEEKAFLSAYSTENDISIDLEEEISIEEVCAHLQSSKGKIVALQEIVKLAIVDGHYHEEERTGALAIAGLVNIEQARFEEIEKWVEDGKEWVERGLQMINDN